MSNNAIHSIGLYTYVILRERDATFNSIFFFFNDTAPPDIYPLPLHDALPILFPTCGRVCLCSGRVYVERPLFERFGEALAQGARALKIGGPYEGAALGPLISYGPPILSA